MNIQSMPSISENGASSSIQEENESIEAHIKTNNETQFFQNMQNKLSRLKVFVQSLGPTKDTEIGKQLLENFQRDPQEFKDMDSNLIIKEAGKRIEKMKKARKIKKNWSSSDMKVLIWVICKYAQQQSINLSQIQSHDEFWKFISSVIPGTSPESCLFKWLSERRYKITLHSWKTEEQKLLVELQKQLNLQFRKYTTAKNKWKIISEELYLQNNDKDKIFRHPKQCRQHYASFLDPNIVKGPWSKNQDSALLTQIALNNGQKKWCKLTKILEGRTENAIKNRYQLLFSKLKKKKQNKTKSEYEIIVEYLKQSDPEFEIKKQRAQAVKNALQEKSSVSKLQNKTVETIKSVQSMPNISPSQPVLIQSVSKLVIPIVLKHGSNFRPFSENEQITKQRKNSLVSLCQSRGNLQEKPLQE